MLSQHCFKEILKREHLNLHITQGLNLLMYISSHVHTLYHDVDVTTDYVDGWTDVQMNVKQVDG